MKLAVVLASHTFKTAAIAVAIATIVAMSPAAAMSLAVFSAADGTALKAHAERARDTSVVIGTLPNGLRYYLKYNPIPTNRVELRLAVRVGSLQEDDDQLGMAHFLEHMAFNGTRRFPGDAVKDVVESWGMNFGADFNAYTSFDETVYRLTVPSDAPHALRQGLHILEDWSRGDISLDSASVVRERGVILEEMRTRRFSPLAASTLIRRFLTMRGPRTRYPHRFPIGSEAQIKSTTVAPLRRFYQDWYRPDLMAIVVVGTFDRTAVEQEIRQTFGGIRTPVTARPLYHDSLPIPQTRVFDVYRPTGITSNVAMSWRMPPRSSNIREAVRQELYERLLLEYIGESLRALQERQMRAYVSGRFMHTTFGRDCKAMTLQIVAQPDSLSVGLQAALTELERIAQHGIPAPILAKKKTKLLQEFEYRAHDGGQLPSREWADQLVEHSLDPSTSLLSPEQYLSLVQELLPTITSATTARAAQFWRDPHSQYVLLTVGTGNDRAMFTQSELDAIVATLSQQTLPPPDPDSASFKTVSSPLHVSSRLTKASNSSGSIVAEHIFAQSGITEWTLSNGARVLYHHNTNHPGEVYLQAYHVGGLLQLPDSLLASSGRFLGELLTREDVAADPFSGTTETSRDGGYVIQTMLNYLDASITVNGSPYDLDTLFDRLHEILAAPPLDSSSIVAWKQRGGRLNALSENDRAIRRYAAPERRTDAPIPQLADNINLDHVRAVFSRLFGNAGMLTFIIVGAVSADQIRPLVESHLAMLPSSPSLQTVDKASPSSAPLLTLLSGRRLQGSRTSGFAGGLVNPVGHFSTASGDYLGERQRFELVAWVAQRRLRRVLREQLNGTYGVHWSAITFELPTPSWSLFIGWETERNRIDELVEAAEREIEALCTQGMTQHELMLGENVQQRALEVRLQSNRYWITTIQDYLRLSISLDRVASPYTKQSLPAMKAACVRYLHLPPI